MSDREADNSEASQFPITRAASMLHNLKVELNEHVTLVAYGQSEIAEGLKIQDNSVHGLYRLCFDKDFSAGLK